MSTKLEGRALVTGASGWVGRALIEHLSARGVDARAWDRTQFPPTDEVSISACLREHDPSAIFHLAMCSEPTGVDDEHTLVNERWPVLLAEWCAANDRRLVVTSSVMVYTDDTPGPYTPETTPDASDGYGALKLAIERAVRTAAPDHASVCRLGWQLGDGATGNNMLRHLTDQHAKEGRVAASGLWKPATSHVCESAVALAAAATAAPGTYLVSTNRDRSFFDIVTRLSAERGLGWSVERDDSYAHDQRMIDDRLWVHAGLGGTPDGPACVGTLRP